MLVKALFNACVAVGLLHPLGTCVNAQVGAAKAAQDSAQVRDLLAESRDALGAAPRDIRRAFLRIIARQQAALGHTFGAESTLALLRGLEPTAPDAALFKGPTSELVCRLLAERKLSDAIEVVRRVTTAEEQDWFLAHLASQLVHLPVPARRSLITAVDDSIARQRHALALLDSIETSAARVDGALAIMEYTGTDRRVRDAAFRLAVAGVDRVVDPVRASSRRAIIAGHALALGDYSLIRKLFDALTEKEDRAYVAHLVIAFRPKPNAGAEDRAALDTLRRYVATVAVRDARAISDLGARSQQLVALREQLRSASESSFATSLVPATLIVSKPTIFSRGRLINRSPVDEARQSLYASDFGGVRRRMGEIRDPDHRALMAKTWVDFAWSTYPSNRDTAAAYLELARSALLRDRPDSATFDEVAALIADRQFWIADHDGGIVTLNVIRDPQAAASAVHNWGTSTFSGLTAARLRQLADRVHESAIRDYVLERVVRGYLAVHGASASQLAWGRALADSIRLPRSRIEAHLAVSGEYLMRGDSLTARAELMPLLSISDSSRNPELPRSVVAFLQVNGDEDLLLDLGADQLSTVVARLIQAGGLDTVLTGIRGDDEPVRRATNLLRVTRWLLTRLQTQDSDYMSWFSNGPDRCRDEF